jgi:hypothetical protein
MPSEYRLNVHFHATASRKMSHAAAASALDPREVAEF